MTQISKSLDAIASGLRLANRLVAAFFIVVAMAWTPALALTQGVIKADAIQAAEPDPALAARLFGRPSATVRISRLAGSPPAFEVSGPEGRIGVIGSTWALAGSVGYSGRPIDILVGVDIGGRIAGAELIQHNEPILTLGISTDDIAKYVSGFAGFDLQKPKVETFQTAQDLPPIIARATVSTGVIRDAILRSARTMALGRGLLGTEAAAIDRVSFSEKSWDALVGEGALSRATLTMRAASEAFGPLVNALPASEAPFLDLWVGVIDTPTIGRNLLGQQLFTRAIGSLAGEDSAIIVASDGAHGHRGTNYVTAGRFDRVELIQGSRTISFSKDDFLRIDKLAAEGAPKFKEISVFRVAGKAGFDPAKPFRLEVSAERERAAGGIARLRVTAEHALPSSYLLAGSDAAAEEPEPLWKQAWRDSQVEIAGVLILLAVLGGILVFQEAFVRRPKLWLYGRAGFLLVTFVWLGWVIGGQLSVVQVVAFIQSLFSGFRWETFLIEPVIFLLWGFVAVGLLFWGRGVFCGWLCPFGALQELLNEGAKRLGVPQIAVPFEVQQRLWAIKYLFYIAILGLSFYSMRDALIVAEVEPFKTAMSMQFNRAWPFVVFVLAQLIAGLFIERFYCRYICPLGAALGIPAKMKLFDWLGRRPQCGRECRYCETVCTVQAIDPLGRINPNECVLCLRCQVIMNDEAQCTVLKQRAARKRGAAAA